MKKSTALLLLFSVSFLLAACNFRPTPTPQNSYKERPVYLFDLSRYAIVYPSDYLSFQIADVYHLRDVIKKLTGVSIPIMSDSAPYSDYEIIIASSKRVTAFEHSINALEGQLDYIIGVSEGDIILGGNNYYADLKAIYEFIDNYIGYDEESDTFTENRKEISGYNIYLYSKPQFTVSAFNNPEIPFTNASQIRALSDAGFNSIIADSSNFTLSEIHDLTRWCTRYDIYLTLRGVNYTEIYNDCPFVNGHCIAEEPYGKDAFEYYSKLCTNYTLMYSQYSWKPYVNFMCQLDMAQYLYEHSEYFDAVDTLMFYKQLFGSSCPDLYSDDYLNEYELFAQAALSRNINLFGYIQSQITDEIDARKQFSWMAYTALCFGANGIQYFNFTVDEEAYDRNILKAAKAMNTELLRLSKAYINYDYLGTYVLGDAAASEHTKLSFAFDGFENVITDFKCLSENEQAFLVGCFENKYTHKYAFCIINTAPPSEGTYSTDAGESFLLQLNTKNTVTCYINGTAQTVSPDHNGYFYFSLKDAQGAFITID